MIGDVSVGALGKEIVFSNRLSIFLATAASTGRSSLCTYMHPPTPLRPGELCAPARSLGGYSPDSAQNFALFVPFRRVLFLAFTKDGGQT